MISEKKVKSIIILKPIKHLAGKIFYFDIYVQHCYNEKIISKCSFPFMGITSTCGNIAITRCRIYLHFKSYTCPLSSCGSVLQNMENNRKLNFFSVVAR